jgi:glycosyltransferase involved in cell wall biosynthesis
MRRATMQDEARSILTPERDQIAVLHVSQPTDGGAARYVADLVADQVLRGWRAVVACPAYGDLAPEVVAVGGVHLDWTAARAPNPSSFLEIRQLDRLIRRERPALVHLHSSKAGLVGRLALRGRLPTIFQPHGWSFDAVTGLMRRATVAWERTATRWATVMLCVSEAERRRGIAHRLHGDWRVIQNGVDIEALLAASTEERAAARRQLELDNRPTVVCVGRLCREKGQDILVDAWPAVLERVPSAQLLLVGDGRDADAVRRRAGKGIHLTGKRSDVPLWLAAADVVAVPSRFDGMSVALLEAMARGRAVVASDVGGAAEAMGDDGGELVRSEDPLALAEALAESLLDPARAAEVGRAARMRVERFHDLRETTAAVADLCVDLISSSTTKTSL